MSQSSTYFSCYLLSAATELSINSEPNRARMKNHSYKPTLKCWTKWSYYLATSSDANKLYNKRFLSADEPNNIHVY